MCMPHHVRYSNAKEFPATSNKEKKTIESNGKRAVHAVGSHNTLDAYAYINDKRIFI